MRRSNPGFCKQIESTTGIPSLSPLSSSFRMRKLQVPLGKRDSDPVSGHHLESITYEDQQPLNAPRKFQMQMTTHGPRQPLFKGSTRGVGFYDEPIGEFQAQTRTWLKLHLDACVCLSSSSQDPKIESSARRAIPSSCLRCIMKWRGGANSLLIHRGRPQGW